MSEDRKVYLHPVQKRQATEAKHVLEEALADDPTEVLIVIFKDGGYRCMAGGGTSLLQQVGALEALKHDLLHNNRGD